MYEALTFEAILERMLGRVDDSFDKREGSVIYDALAPAAVELQSVYFELDRILQESFADTQSRDYLLRRAAERGLSAKPASCAVRRGEFSGDVPPGTRFSLGALNYVSGEKIADGAYKMTCETPGEAGNTDRGTLLPIDYVDGLTRAELTDVLVPGADAEDTEAFRRRYFESLEAQAFGGNVADYRKTVGAMEGVGGVKVLPVWNGPGTVKVIFTDAAFGAPDASAVAAVQDALDPPARPGAGVGLAPIGHVVTVTGAKARPVAVSTALTLSGDWSLADVLPRAEDALDAYFSGLAAAWSGSQTLTVRVSQIESRLLDLDGVLDAADTKLNGAAGNLTLADDEIPVRGELHATQTS